MIESGRPVSNLIIRASAGSGKTYLLVQRFLKLLVSGQAPEQILAVTFTVKAAGEILGRVLIRMAEAVENDEIRQQLSVELDEPLTKELCRDLLEVIASRLHRLNVSTLDSFFIRLSASSTLSAQLPIGWKIVEDTVDRGLRAQALEQVLQAAQANPDTWKQWLDSVNELALGQSVRGVWDLLTDLVTHSYSYFRDSHENAWNCLPAASRFTDEKVTGLLTSLDTAILPEHKSISKAHLKNIADARAGDWNEFIKKGLAAKVLSQENKIYKKDIPSETISLYADLIEHARAVLLEPILRRNSSTYTFLKVYDNYYCELKRQHRAYRFEDVTESLAQGSTPPLAELFLQIDSHLQHLLLDEFQDTSIAQWRALRPFAQKSGDPGGLGSFFCVGDDKQAIYGWRGGTSDLFGEVRQLIDGISEERLDITRRSSPVIISFVNQIFGALNENSVLARSPVASAWWSDNFKPHETKRSEYPGHVRILTSPVAEKKVQSQQDEGSVEEEREVPGDEKQDDVRLEFAARKIIDLYQQRPNCTMGVLTRTNASVARLIFLLKREGVPASEEGKMTLTHSPAVALVLSLLTFADHPGDTAAQFHVAHSPLAKDVGMERDSRVTAASLARRIRERLLLEGYGPLISHWTEVLAPHCDSRDLNRLVQLTDLGYRFPPALAIRPGEFVELVNEKRMEDRRPGKIRVMTVHQSKGLEFDVVVLPELDKHLKAGKPRVVTHREETCSPYDTVLLGVTKDIQSLLPEKFQKMFSHFEDLEVRESLCTLYVALTRAVHALHLIVDPSKESEKNLPFTFAGLVRSAVCGGKRAEPGQTIYESGDPEWCVKQTTAKMGWPTPSAALPFTHIF